MKRSTFKTAAVAAGTVALVAALAACAPAAQEPAAAPSGGESDAPAAAAPAETPEPDSFGVVVAESWKDIYPNEYQTYMANESNSPQGKQDYLTEYPELVTMYAGYGFAKGYDEAAGHPYSLQSVAETPRVNENTLAQLHHLQDAPVHRHGELRGRFGLPEALRRGAHADDRAHQLLQLP